ncbi:hypothetical protein [uncultured Traorella sp.]|uniref:hypothetical protein n=1 Tax=uncultured Traorella sp. TaxID=1929048 RepID=UPI0025DB58D5|nr:hypothetical protein [uncultured Traorella sp.]
MKKNIRSLLFTLLCCILLTLIVSLILSFLYFLNLFVSSLALISKIFGFLVLIICGFLLGRNIREKTFFFALGFALAGFLICFIFVEKSVFAILLLAAKWLIFIIAALFARSI